MPLKIALIGAGFIGFSRCLMQDLLSEPEFAETTLTLMDIDLRNLGWVTQPCQRDNENIYFAHFGGYSNLWSGDVRLFVLHVPPNP